MVSSGKVSCIVCYAYTRVSVAACNVCVGACACTCGCKCKCDNVHSCMDTCTCMSSSAHSCGCVADGGDAIIIYIWRLFEYYYSIEKLHRV